MAHRGRKTAKGKASSGSAGRGLWIMLGALAVALVAAAAVFTLRGDVDEVDFPDVHGLAVDRGNPDALYVATHSGLVRWEEDRGWKRVGGSRDDFMGFSAHPSEPNVFWASGHPHDPSAATRNLGLRKSEDGGLTWRTIGAEGADFHAMAVSPANPDALWGYYAQRLHASRDGGVTWSAVGTTSPRILGLAGHPGDADVLYAGTPDGILRSDDGGLSWSAPLRPGVAIGVAIDPNAPDALYVATGAGVARSTDGGATWTDLPLAAGGQVAHVAVSPHDGRVVYAATSDAGVHRSLDGGATWTRIHAGRG